ncbi:MAG TPA: ABC transporter substrate-binding protein [Thermomicrobiales bacterium]|nr:ABC transporter substrate-binding protein [Thermomicrobiales bacterium]
MNGIGRTNRRALVGGAAASGVGLALSGGQFAGASPLSGSGRTGFAAQGTGNLPTPRDQTLVIEQETSNVWDSFNAFIPNGDAYNYGISQLARENLFYVNFVTGEIKPWLAEKFEYNADHTEVTLHLNPKVKWSDGTPWTSADVVFSQQMLLDNPQLNGAAGVIADVKSVKATDEHTVVWTLNEPLPRFHYRFYAGVIADGVQVVPKHIWEKEDPGTFKDNPPVRTGPYTLKEASSSKLYYLWEKNPDYWAKDVMDPAPQYVLYVQATSPDTSVQEFIAGNIDIGIVDYLNQQVIMGQTDKTAQNIFADPCPRGFYFNEASPSGLFTHPEAKWAFSHLLDRDTIAKTISQPESRPAHYPWADYDGWKKWAPDDVINAFDWSFDPEKAKALLDGIGATQDGDTRSFNGKAIQLTMICPMPTNNPMFQIGETLVAEAAKLGIQIDHKSLPGSAFWDTYAMGEYDISNHWLCGMEYDPIQVFGGFNSKNFQPVGTRVTSGGDQGSARVQSKELDDVLAQLEEIGPDDPKAAALYSQALKIWGTNLFSMPSIEQIAPMLFNTTYWTNWPPTENPQTIPANWWGGFLFTVGNLKKA